MVYGLGFKVEGSFRVEGLGLKVHGLGFRVFGFRLQGSRLRVETVRLGLVEPGPLKQKQGGRGSRGCGGGWGGGPSAFGRPRKIPFPGKKGGFGGGSVLEASADFDNHP